METPRQRDKARGEISALRDLILPLFYVLLLIVSYRLCSKIIHEIVTW